jgi:type I restriction enzyme S subunit
MVRIGDVARTTSGKTPSRSRLSYWQPATVPWVKTGEITFAPICQTEEAVSPLAVQECFLPLLPPGTVLVAMYGQGKTRGQSAVLEIEATTNQACFAILPSDAFVPEYLQYWLRYSYLSLRESSEGRGGNQSNLNGEILGALMAPRIDRTAQTEIAVRLKAQLAEAEIARQSVQMQWDEARVLKSKALEAVFNCIKDWQPIGSVAKLQSGYAFKSDTFKHNGVRLLRNANILPGIVYWDDAVFLSEDDAQRYSEYVLGPGDVLISLDRPIISSGIKVARVGESDLPALLVQRVGRFLLDPEQLHADYLYAFLQTDLFTSKVSGHDQSLGVPHISPSQVEAIEMPLPDVAIQRQLAKRLKGITDAWSVLATGLQAQLHDLSILPQRLLAQAFGS